MDSKIVDTVCYLYGEKAGKEVAQALVGTIENRSLELKPPGGWKKEGFPMDESDALLITYGDQFQREGTPPLEVLEEFASNYMVGVFSGIHILPFFPYTSDDGFSISDFNAVDPNLGGWGEIEKLGLRWKLMSDLVINHCSVSHRWFKGFISDESPYNDYFIAISPETDLSGVARPRAHPLLTPFETVRGTQHVWTTFSADQVDLNFANPKVLIEMIDLLLFHVSRGIQVIRLDAIPYLWKEPGHSSIHHPKTHAVVKLIRCIVEENAPWVVVITESNVPHKENISYFGSGDDEAHMVYQFALPPLTLDAFLRGDSSHLREWIMQLPQPDGRYSYFNFLASHDGIGLLPAHGILSEEEMDAMIRCVIERGGRVNYKATKTGRIPYELNINYLSAVAEKELPTEVRAQKFLASQSLLLILPGVPGIYAHSFIGSENWEEGVAVTGMNRSINRAKLDFAALQDEVDTPGSLRNMIVEGYSRMLKVRRGERAFHPGGGIALLESSPQLLALRRIPPGGEGREVLCITNFSSTEVPFSLEENGASGFTEELLRVAPPCTANSFDTGMLTMPPCGVLWLTAEPE